MIQVTRLNGEPFYVNQDLIEFIEETPDTVLSMTTGRKVIVREGAQDICLRIECYKKRIFPEQRTRAEGKA